MSGDLMKQSKNVEIAIEKWKSYNKEKQFSDQLEELLSKNDTKELERLFLTRLGFGTAGIRGKMGPGFASMNDVVVIQTTQGLLDHLRTTAPDLKTQGVVIGFDGRYNSKRFAELVATVFVQDKVKVYLYSDVTPTPFVPFGMKCTGAVAGIMITASHNPKEDNGYKLYWRNAIQITSPYDKEVESSILRNLVPKDTSWKIDVLCDNELVDDNLDFVSTEYYKLIKNGCFDLKLNSKSRTLYTYSAMHGVGFPYVLKAFHEADFQEAILVVKEQETPDPDFPTVKYPNPEEGKEALELSFQTAEKGKSTMILANDPDADRLAVAEMDIRTGKWHVFSGNEIGTLLGWWMLHTFKLKNTNKTSFLDVYLISTIVSSRTLSAIAAFEGFGYEETYTGFKWIGNRALQLRDDGFTVIFAYEEAIGFMCNDVILDKDGVSAAVRVAEMKDYLKNQGFTMMDKLEELRDTYGRYIQENSYFFCDDPQIIEKIFERLRNFDGEPLTYPKKMSKWIISNVKDYTVCYDSTTSDLKTTLPKSSSQIIKFYFESNDLVIAIRASGTEPKVKYYAEMKVDSRESDGKEILRNAIDSFVDEFLQPTQNGLTARVDK